MRIAIVSSLTYHIECAGFLIASLGAPSAPSASRSFGTGQNADATDNNHKITLFVPVNKTHGYETYFMTLYDGYFTIKDIREFKDDEFDRIIKLTASDRIKTPNNKTISIVHKADMSDRSAKKLVLSPYVKLRPEPLNIMPVYQGLIKHHDEIKGEILWIGQLEDKWIDNDLLNFISKVKFHFTFVISTGHGRGAKLKNIPNVTVINSISTGKMIDIIQDSDLILCRKFPFQRKDRFSGVLTLGLSHDKPMIMNEGMANDYGIPGILFKKDYCELLEYINNIDVSTVNKHIDDIIVYREKTMRHNQICLCDLIQQ